MKKIDEILKQLPSSWEELKLKDFVKITSVEVVEEGNFDNLFVGLDNSVKVISALTDIPAEELESMPMSDVNRMAAKMGFMVAMPDRTKSKLKWKRIEDVTYNDYVTFVTLSEDLYNNMALIIKTFATNEMTEDEINELSMQEVYSGFFTLQRSARKSLNGMTMSLGLKLAKQSLRETWQRLTRRRKKSQNK